MEAVHGRKWIMDHPFLTFRQQILNQKTVGTPQTTSIKHTQNTVVTGFFCFLCCNFLFLVAKPNRKFKKAWLAWRKKPM